MLSKVVGTQTRDVERNNALFKSLQNDLPPQVSSINVWTMQGENAGSLDPSAPVKTQNVSSRLFFKSALSSTGVAVEAPFPSVVNGAEVSVFALRIEREGQLAGVVAVTGPLRNLQQLLAPESVGPPGSVITVSNEHGIVLARSIDPNRWIN